MLDIKITPAQALKPQPDPDKLVFGKTFTDQEVPDHFIIPEEN